MNPPLKSGIIAGFMASALCGSLAAGALVGEPLFVSGQDGYHTYRIPALAVTTKGTVLAFCEGRKHSWNDAGDIDLLVKRSTDDGRTWSGQQVIWDDADNTCGNPCAVMDRDTGTVWLAACRNNRRVFVTWSDDDGRTWHVPREITADVKPRNWTWYATGPGNGIQIAHGPHKGRLVIPCDHIEADTKHYYAHVIYSDDHGKRWKLGGSTPEHQVNECAVVELAGGKLMLNMRNYDRVKQNRQVAFSDDGGLTWKDQRFDDALIEPICQAAMARYRWPENEKGSVILFSNPASAGRRINMRVRASFDEGETWPVSRLLHAGPSGYSALDVLPDGQIACLYEGGETNLADGIVFARFPLASLLTPDGTNRLPVAVSAPKPADSAKPNILYILADDLGYGDVQCLNPTRGKIPTPNLDRLAAQGMIFTDAHGSSAVCTPTRYGILTGRYNWRSRLQGGVLGEYGDALIARNRLTVPGLLKQHGYATACIGKWHLGWQWPREGKQVDFSRPIAEGPTTRGFDYYFGTDVPNYPPYCFIENDRTVGSPSVPLPKRLLGNNLASKPGPALPGWKLEQILPTITAKACDYIRRQAATGGPFFLYFPLTSPHTPLAVTTDWRGKSGLNRYADYVMETDAMIGRVLDAVDQSGVASNTLVIVTSDNGCAPYIGVPELEAKGHFPSGPFRGYKADAWDGGHHIPFVARWPGVTKPGTRCAQLTCLTDLMATCADVLGAALPAAAGEDSVSMLPLLRGENRAARETIVHHSIGGKFAIREGPWKLLLCAGSGGWGTPRDGAALQQGLPVVQLYDLSRDVAEQQNLQSAHPEIVARLTSMLEKYVADGRSTPGAPQTNDVPVDIFKTGK